MKRKRQIIQFLIDNNNNSKSMGNNSDQTYGNHNHNTLIKL